MFLYSLPRYESSLQNPAYRLIDFLNYWGSPKAGPNNFYCHFNEGEIYKLRIKKDFSFVEMTILYLSCLFFIFHMLQPPHLYTLTK